MDIVVVQSIEICQLMELRYINLFRGAQMDEVFTLYALFFLNKLVDKEFVVFYSYHFYSFVEDIYHLSS